MTLTKIALTAGLFGALLSASLAPAQAQSAGRMWTGSHHHHYMGRHHRRGYTYGSRFDNRHQTRTGGPVGGLRDRN